MTAVLSLVESSPDERPKPRVQMLRNTMGVTTDGTRQEA